MATLEKVQNRIAKLQRQAEALLRQKNAAVIAGIRALMVEHGLTAADIDVGGGAAKTGAKRGRKPGMAAAAARKRAAARPKGKLPPKYMNPATGETWSGHARPPAWIKDVKDRTKFLIAGTAAGAADTAKQKPAAAGTRSGAKVKAVAPRAAAKRVAARKAATEKTTAARKAAGKTATKKASVKRASSRKVGAKRTAARKAATAKQPVRRSASNVEAAAATL